MKTITFECETITPMFLSGADGSTPELRGPSIKGALRFWWRAMNGHLELKKLKEAENAILGGTDNAGRSRIIIRTQIIKQEISVEELVPHKPFMRQTAFKGSQTTFRVMLSLMQENDTFDMERLESLFMITATLGGFGKRSRRGMGSVNIISHKQPKTLEQILPHLKKFSPYFSLSYNRIVYNFSGRMEAYASIREIQIGEPLDNSRALLLKISNTTHKFHSKEPYAYDASLGNARGGRFASPVYVSVLKGSALPIVTTLKTAPNRNLQNVDISLQEEFKTDILS